MLLMATKKEPLKKLGLPLTDEERERISMAAAARDLNDSTFAKMVLLGAIHRGGGTLDQLVALGERQVEGQRMTRRAGRDYTKSWTAQGDQTWIHESGEWVLVKFTPKGSSRNTDDQANWWHLAHNGDPEFMKPLSFVFEDAARLAVEEIERQAAA